MSFQRIPWTNFHDLNLDWMIDKMKTFESMIQKFAEAYDGFEADLDQFTDQMNQNTADISSLQEIVSDHTTRIANMQHDLTSLATTVSNNYNEANYRFKQIADQINDIISQVNLYMYSPFTGEYVSVETVIYELAAFHITGGIHAGDYDALALTAQAYDNYGMSAYTYDSNAANILIPTP